MIRIHVIINNLENAAPDYTMATKTNDVFVTNLQTLYPELTKRLPKLQMVEEYDPHDFNDEGREEYAWVANYTVSLNSLVQSDEEQKKKAQSKRLSTPSKSTPNNIGARIESTISSGMDSDAVEAITGIRDQVAGGQEVGWWIVFNGDPQREGLDDSEDAEDEDDDEETEGEGGQDEEDAYSNDGTETRKAGLDSFDEVCWIHTTTI